MPTDESTRPQRRKLLTDSECRRARPREKPYALSDGNHLRLRVMPSGQKYWQVRYHFDGRERTFQIGTYQEAASGPRYFGILAAREARNEVMALVHAGQDPNVVKRQMQGEAPSGDEAADGGVMSVQALAEQWLDRKVGKSKRPHLKRLRSAFARDVYPPIGRMHVASVTHPIVLNRVLRPVEDRGSLESAHRLRSLIHSFYEAMDAEGHLPEGFKNPAGEKLSKALKRPPRIKPQPAITDLKALREFLMLCEALPAYPISKLANRFVHLTAVRSGTLRFAEWSQFQDLDGPAPVWKVPPGMMKREVLDFEVPLSRQAVEVLDAARRISGGGRFVFPQERHSHKPISENDVIFLIYRAGGKGKHTCHGARAAFSTIMNERHPEERQVIELALAHEPRSKVEKAYNRATLSQRRREVLQEYADLLTGC